ncbi:MAG: hypothetical protein WAV16_00975, partial [Candidatus Moraniibacteriota bacterium]
VEVLIGQDEILKDEIRNRETGLIFFIGEDYRKIKNLQDNLAVYDEKIELMENSKGNIVDENILNEVNADISVLKEKREDFANFIQSRGKDFSLWGWLFEKIYLSNEETIFGIFKLS